MGYIFYYGGPLVAFAAIILALLAVFQGLLQIKCKVCYYKNQKSVVFCRNCGSNLINQHEDYEKVIFNTGTIVMAFFIPPIAWYLYLNFKDEYPHRARKLILLSIGSPIILTFNVLGGFALLYSGFYY